MNPSTPDFFETMYRANQDPWDFASSPYELARYDAIVAALSPGQFQQALEPGCSVGVLTQRLAAFCDSVHAFDFSSTAVSQARRRCANLLNVHITCGQLDRNTASRHPLAQTDLLILSEIGYYFTAPQWLETANALIAALPSGATVLAAHWLGHSHDHRLSGDEVHELLRTHPHLHLDHAERHAHFRLNRWTRQ